MLRWTALAVLGVAVFVAVVWLFWGNPRALDEPSARMRAVYLGVLLAFLLASVAVRWRGRPAILTHLRLLLVWVIVGLVLAVGYEFVLRWLL